MLAVAHRGTLAAAHRRSVGPLHPAGLAPAECRRSIGPLHPAGLAPAERYGCFEVGWSPAGPLSWSGGCSARAGRRSRVLDCGPTPASWPRRTRSGPPGPDLPFRRCTTCRKDRAASGDRGSASQPGIVRPSAGKAARSTVECAASRALFVRVSAITTHALTVAPSVAQPRSLPIRAASRLRRSIEASRSCTSTMAVFSSTTSSIRRASCHASTSITPRSP